MNSKNLGAGLFCLCVLLVLVLWCFGNFHIINGSKISIAVVEKGYFGFSETFISVDKITGMPWIAAKSKYPLGCKVLQRKGYIETDEQFDERNKKEAQEVWEETLEQAQKEQDKIMKDASEKWEEYMNQLK